MRRALRRNGRPSWSLGNCATAFSIAPSLASLPAEISGALVASVAVRASRSVSSRLLVGQVSNRGSGDVLGVVLHGLSQLVPMRRGLSQAQPPLAEQDASEFCHEVLFGGTLGLVFCEESRYEGLELVGALPQGEERVSQKDCPGERLLRRTPRVSPERSGPPPRRPCAIPPSGE